MGKSLRSLLGSKTTEFVELCKKLYIAEMSNHNGNNSAEVYELFSQICRIGKYKHCRITWQTTFPDVWDIAKNGCQYRLDIDAIRFGNENIRCEDLGRSI